MRNGTRMFGAAACIMVLAATPLWAQNQPAPPDALVGSVREASGYMREMITKAADQMSEEDYAYKPTPAVRSFGQLLAHVADGNYMFCSAVKGEKPPVADVEKTATARAEIQKALAASFTYCDAALAGLTDPRAPVQMGRRTLPALSVVMFTAFHNAEHYGNVVTYMRLRGKVPPSSQPRPTA